MTSPTTITATPNLPYVEVTREFAAPAAAVFRAHTDRDLFARWLGPAEAGIELTDFTATPGGVWRYVTHGEGHQFVFHGTFHTVRPNELLVQTFEFDGAPDAVGLSSTTFTETNGRTRLTVRELYPSVAARDMALAAGMEPGIIAGYERLDALLAS